MTLYKYLPAERVGVLRDREIRFSQPDALNDPYEVSVVFESMIPPECVPALVAHLDETGELDSARSDGIERGIDEALQELEAIGLPVHLFDRDALHDYVLAEFEALGGKAFLHDVSARVFTDATGSGNPVAMRILTDRYRASINENVGVLCLSEAWDVLKMWSHYAGVHTGLVLGFDADDPYFRQQYVTLIPTEIRPVIYGDEVPRFEGFDPLGEPEQLLKLGDPFFQKGPEWAEEREWRLLRPLGSAVRTIPAEPYPVHLMRFPDRALCEVVVGARASASTRAAVGDALAQGRLHHVVLYEARLAEGKRALERHLAPHPSVSPAVD